MLITSDIKFILELCDIICESNLVFGNLVRYKKKKKIL